MSSVFLVPTTWQDKHFTKKLNESEYEALWDGGEFELPARYGAIQMVYWVSMMYGTGLPVLYVLAFMYFTMCYWIDVSILIIAFFHQIN